MMPTALLWTLKRTAWPVRTPRFAMFPPLTHVLDLGCARPGDALQLLHPLAALAALLRDGPTSVRRSLNHQFLALLQLSNPCPRNRLFLEPFSVLLFAISLTDHLPVILVASTPTAVGMILLGPLATEAEGQSTSRAASSRGRGSHTSAFSDSVTAMGGASGHLRSRRFARYGPTR